VGKFEHGFGTQLGAVLLLGLITGRLPNFSGSAAGAAAFI